MTSTPLPVSCWQIERRVPRSISPLYEVRTVAVRAWRDFEAAGRLRGLVGALAGDGGLVRVDDGLAAQAAELADSEGLWVYDAAYVAGARTIGAQLVSCDLHDLVSRGLAITPRRACAAT